MRIRLILFVIGGSIALLVYGIDNISNSAGDSKLAARNKKCITLTYEQFVKRHPTEGWFHVTGCVLDLPSARAHLITYGHDKEAEDRGTVTSLDIPLRSVKNYDRDDAPPSPLLVITENDELVNKWKALNEQGKDLPDDDEKGESSQSKQSSSETVAQKERLEKYITDNWDKIYVRQDVEGIIKTSSVIEKDADQSEPDKAPDHMTADYVVLDEGKTGEDYQARSTTNGVVALSILAGCWGLGIFLWRLSQRPPKGGIGNSETITITNRYGETVVLNTDAADVFRKGGTGSGGPPNGGPQNPWSGDPGSFNRR